jgi:hypothetical protein
VITDDGFVKNFNACVEAPRSMKIGFYFLKLLPLDGGRGGVGVITG